MPVFSSASKLRLSEAHQDLQTVFNEVIKIYDCSIICGFRGKAEQNAAYKSGKSKKKWPDGDHNKKPSEAVDATPYPIEWDDKERFVFFAGIVFAVSSRLFSEGKIKHRIGWGGDWNNDGRLKDETFRDLNHFYIIKFYAINKERP